MKVHTKQKFLGACAILLLISLACNLGEPQVQSGALIFMDDFSPGETSWEIWSKNGVSAVGLVDGKLTMILQQPNTDIITSNHVNHPNLEISVSTRKEHGSNDNLIGLVCRYQNDENYYGFLISSDGYFGIIKKFQGDVQLINSEMMQYSDIINKGDKENSLSAICDDESLVFIINNVEVASVQDADLPFGENGLLIGSFTEPDGLVVTFDDFVLRSR